MGKLRSQIWVIALAFALLASNALAEKNIVFLGDSLTAGLGVEPGEAFPALIEHKIRSANLSYHVEIAGVSGDTTAGGLRRIDWLLQKPIDLLVVELGANDGLRGLPISEIKKNLNAILQKLRAINPNAKVVIAGMQIPPNLGAQYATGFQHAFEEVAAENHAALIPFLLQDVGGIRALNQPDMIHPTAAGHRIVAENVWRFLEPLLRNE